jgi:hypothetical protein
MLESEKDFGMIILSNLSDIQAVGGLNQRGRESVDSLKEFIFDYYKTK